MQIDQRKKKGVMSDEWGTFLSISPLHVSVSRKMRNSWSDSQEMGEARVHHSTALKSRKGTKIWGELKVGSNLSWRFKSFSSTRVDFTPCKEWKRPKKMRTWHTGQGISAHSLAILWPTPLEDNSACQIPEDILWTRKNKKLQKRFSS